jgi:uncharacterized coiled-coil protein SlyX
MATEQQIRRATSIHKQIKSNDKKKSEIEIQITFLNKVIADNQKAITLLQKELDNMTDVQEALQEVYEQQEYKVIEETVQVVEQPV